MKKVSDSRTGLVSNLAKVFLGGIVTAALKYLLKSPNGPLPEVVQSFTTGAILTWMFTLARGFQNVLNDSLRQLDISSRALDYQRNALNTLLKDKIHTKALHALVTESVQEKFHLVPCVNVNSYLSFLQLAIEQGTRFEGVHNESIRYYRNTNRGEEYLQKLRDKKMVLKRRVFIIDEMYEQEMLDDLKDQDLMDFYWENSGKDMETYWILRRDFMDNYMTLSEVPRDFGLYDTQLLISYDEKRQVVTFEVVDETAIARRFFDALNRQLEGNYSFPFTRINH